MTREDATELLEIFREESDDTPPVNSYVLANAYLKVLGSLSPVRGGYSR